MTPRRPTLSIASAAAVIASCFTLLYNGGVSGRSFVSPPFRSGSPLRGHCSGLRSYCGSPEGLVQPPYCEDDLPAEVTDIPTVGGSARRRLLWSLGASVAAFACAASGLARKADALVSLGAPPETRSQRYDLPRNKMKDAGFAQGMAYGMVDYERAVSSKKRELFDRMFRELPRDGSVVVEVGMGSFPNALYFGSKEVPGKLDIIGVDPNDSMASYAQESATRAGVLGAERGNTLRITHGVAEALPLADASADAVVCTLTLCSVLDPSEAVAEIKRILKPGGKFLFLEHVLSETDANFAVEQKMFTPMQVARADGCHLDRRTLEIIKSAGFKHVDGQYFELANFRYLNPTVAGLATL